MKSKWIKKQLCSIVDFNPKEVIKKGTIAKKISMDVLRPFCRDIPFYTEECYSGGTKFRNGDTIMARITPCLENGKTAQVSILNDGEVGFGSTEYIVFRAKDGIIDKDYLYYLVCSPNVREPAIKSMVGSSGRQRVQTDVIKNLELEIPSLIEQEKIGSFLKLIDDKIAFNDKINNNLEQQALALFDHMFPNVSIGNGYIGDIIIPKRGKGLLSKNAIPGDVPVVAGGLEPATYHNVSNTVSPVLTISASGANAGFVNLWHKPVWSSDSSFIDHSMTKDVYFWYVMLKKRQKEIFDSQTGSAQPHIYPKHIAEMPVCKLNQKDIDRFIDFVTPLFEKIGKNKIENDKLISLRDTLLPKLMSGELDVSAIDL